MDDVEDTDWMNKRARILLLLVMVVLVRIALEIIIKAANDCTILVLMVIISLDIMIV